jgi:Bacterial archaeo-eukaryotic release factor family 10
MLSAKDVLSLTELTSPVLTAYISIDPMKRSAGKSALESVTWLRQEGKAIGKNLPPTDVKDFRKQLNRTQEFLTDRRPKAKGIVILAGPTTWKLFPVRLRAENELHWGKPALSQLFNLVDEERPSLIVAIDRAGARFLRYELGEMTEYEESKFHIDASQWKKKEHAHMARRATEMPHGNQRDVFNQRMDAQYMHLCREVSKRAEALSKKEGLFSLVLVGSKRLTEPIEAALPHSIRENVTLVTEDLARVPSSVFQKHIGSAILAQARQYATRLVDQLLKDKHGTVLGLDETLAQLQNGRISTVIVARGLDRTMKQCMNCGLVNSSADLACPACSAERHAVRFSDALPELLQLHRTDIEIANGAAAERLYKAGGIGGWLRQPSRAE